MTAPLFFVFDGVDGAGKSTQIERFVRWLESSGKSVVLCREPGTSELGEEVRELLLNSEGIAIGNRAEMLLYMAARAQLVEQVVRPALDAGKSVVSDRYLLANVVYQGHAGGLDPGLIWQVGQVATHGVAPNVTIVLDLDPTTAEQRRSGTAPDRMERRGLEYFQRVRDGFLREAEKDSNAIKVVNADGSPDEVELRVRHAVRHVFSSNATG